MYCSYPNDINSKIKANKWIYSIKQTEMFDKIKKTILKTFGSNELHCSYNKLEVL